MKYRIFAVGVVVLALVAAGTAWVISRDKPRTAAVHGADLFSTNATGGNFNHAVMALHGKLGKWMLDKKGNRHDPTFRQSARNWHTGPSSQSVRMILARGSTEFQDSKGNIISIDTIQEQGRPLYVFVEYGGEGGPLVIINGLLAELQVLGVKVQ